MGFHPDNLVSPTASKPVRAAYWTAKYLVMLVLAYALIGGLALLFEPSITIKALGALTAVAAILIGRWLWRAKAVARDKL